MTSSAHSPIAFAQGHGPACAATEAAEAPTFGEIYEAQFDFVWRSARRLAGPGVSVDDVVQEVFVVVHRRFADRQGDIPLRAWLYAIVVNVARSQRRRARKVSVELPRSGTGEDVDQTVFHPGPSPDDALARLEALEALEAIIGGLDEEKFEVFVLVELEQLTVPHIAELLGINQNTAYARLRAARQEVEDAMARHRARDAWRMK